MAVDGHRGNAEGRSKDDRCRLATDAMERGELLHVRWDLAVELVEQPPRHPAQRLGLLVVKARSFDVALEDTLSRRCIVRRSPVFAEERRRHLVDALVLGLRREDRRHQEFQRTRESERWSPVRIRHFEPSQDRPRTLRECRIRSFGDTGDRICGSRRHPLNHTRAAALTEKHPLRWIGAAIPRSLCN